MGGCEMFNLIKQGVASAAQADMILCFIAAMNDQDSFANLSDSSGDSVDVYDSAWHIFNLNIVSDDEEDGAPDRIKMRVVKDESGSITNFEMFMCSLVDGSLVQNEYTSQEISDSSLAMTAVGFHSDAYGSGGHSVDVTGTLDGSGAFTERIVTLSDSGNYGGGLHSQSGILTQLPGSFAFEGYRYGTHEGGSYQDVIIGIGEMLGDNSSELSSLAVGDGAVVYSSSGTYDGGTYEHSGTDAWLGDGCLPIEPPDSSSFYEEANAGTLPTVGDVSIGFAADQTWDCTDDVGVGIVDLPITEQSMMNAACSAYAVDHEWVNCWEIIQP